MDCQFKYVGSIPTIRSNPLINFKFFSMNQFYLVKVSMEFDSGNGKMKVQKETYLVSAVSVTDAEAKMYDDFKGYSYEWKVVSVTVTPIVKVID